ncbi:MAG: type II secretion system F family protein [Nocardioides sp.]
MTSEIVYVALSAALLACSLVAVGVHHWLDVRYESRLARSLGRTGPTPIAAWLDPWLIRLPLLSRIGRLLGEGDLNWRLTYVVGIWALVAYPVFYVLRGMYGLRLGLVLAVVAIPGLTLVLVRQLVNRRRERYRKQILDLARHLAGSARAGLSVSHALTAAADALGDPIGGELRGVVLAMEFGTLPDHALDRFRDRSRLPEGDLLVNAIVIQQRSGGDLVALLTRLAGGMEAFGRGRTEAAGIVAGVAAMPWMIIGIVLCTLYVVNQGGDGVLDQMHRWPFLEIPFYLALLVIVSLVPLMKRLTRIEPPS